MLSMAHQAAYHKLNGFGEINVANNPTHGYVKIILSLEQFEKKLKNEAFSLNL